MLNLRTLSLALVLRGALCLPQQWDGGAAVAEDSYGSGGCSGQPTWFLTNITYSSSMLYSTPAHLATKGANFEFQLTNSEMQYTTSCKGYGNSRVPDFFYGDETYTCDKPSGFGAAPSDMASFTFSKPDGAISVNQTWTCLGQHPTKRTGNAKGLVRLDCNTVNWTNPDWSIGQTYSTTTTTCAPSQLRLVPSPI